jgi:UDP-N-acetyl-D-glucosamine dehydrogenase
MLLELTKRIEDRDSSIGIVGLGYVGLPLALRFAEAGFKVVGFDIDPRKAEAIAKRQSYFSHISHERVGAAIDQGLSVTSDMAQASDVDAIIICVPTPLGKHQEPDLSFVTNTMDALAPHIRAGQVISLESTTYPGTTEEEIVPRLEAQGLSVGKEVFVVYSPEREDPGNKSFATQTIPKVIGGHTQACLMAGSALYGEVIDQLVPVSSTRTAEMTKLLENIHRAVNIGLANELKVVADKMGIDIFEVINAAASKPFGFTPYYPGPGLGGHCIPIDPFYLTWKAKEYGVNTRFIELAGEVNTAMPVWVLGKVEAALNQRGKALNGSNVLVIGIAYKKDTSDTRESPGLKILAMLQAKGAKTAYYDPFVPEIPKLRQYELVDESIEISAQRICDQDCVVVCTDHSGIDYELIETNATLVVDTRNVFPSGGENIVAA